MTELQLFLGIPVDAHLAARLKSTKEYTRLISSDPDCLIELNGAQGCFIGKKIDQFVDNERLRNAEANIYSLLNKLDPNYSFKSIPLILFPHHE